MSRAPDNPAVRMNLAQLESMDGNYKASLGLISPIAESLRSSPDGLVLLAGTYLGLGNKDSARKLVSDWMALGEGVAPPLAIEFAKPLAEHGLAAEAVRVLEKAKWAGAAARAARGSDLYLRCHVLPHPRISSEY
mgnify:FL=1